MRRWRCQDCGLMGPNCICVDVEGRDYNHDTGVHIMAAKTSKKKTSRQKPPENETPAAAFARLATGRTNKAVKAISLIAQLTGSAYESTEVEQRAVVTALEVAVEQVKDTFAGNAKSSDTFKLPKA